MLLSLLLLITGMTGDSIARKGPVENRPAHALYLSVIQIDHREPGSEAEVLVKVFINDLEDVIRATYPATYQRSEPDTFCQANKQWIEQYFQTHLVCVVNNKQAELSFLNSRRENEVFWLKFSLNTLVEWKEVKVKASFFMEIFSTQSNIIHLLHGSDKRFARLTKGSVEVVFSF